LESFFQKGLPVLAGLSATYLYDCAREYEGSDRRLHFHDEKGRPHRACFTLFFWGS